MNQEQFDSIFTATPEEMAIIKQIAERAVKMAKDLDIEYDQTSAVMDIEACHCNGNPLDLQRLLDAADGDFGHDVFGIRRFMDRDEGKLSGVFSPRHSAKERQTT